MFLFGDAKCRATFMTTIMLGLCAKDISAFMPTNVNGGYPAPASARSTFLVQKSLPDLAKTSSIVFQSHYDDDDLKVSDPCYDFDVHNIALGKPATISSMRGDRPASNAVDGSTSGATKDITHTEIGKPGTWSVDLEGSFFVQSIVIWNRSEERYINQLNNFTVEVINNSGSVVWSEFHAGVPNPNATFTLPTSVKGSKVQVSRSDFLQLAEVQVFGIGPL